MIKIRRRKTRSYTQRKESLKSELKDNKNESSSMKEEIKESKMDESDSIDENYVLTLKGQSQLKYIRILKLSMIFHFS